MNIIEVDCKFIALTGAIFSSHFTISNSHELLAVMFEVLRNLVKVEAKPNLMQIEPQRGMIMQMDRKIIKIRLKPELRPSAEKIEKQQNSLIIRATYFCEYNKKMMEKNSMRGWSKISKEIQQLTLRVDLNFEKQISKMRQQIYRGDALKHSRKTNSFEKFRENSMKRVKDSKLNEDLDFIFRNEEFKKLYSPQKALQSSSNKFTYQINQPIITNSYETRTAPQLLERSPNMAKISSKIGNKNSVSPPKDSNPYVIPKDISQISKIYQGQTIPFGSQVTNNNRALELIILAAISAFFVALGEKIGHLFKY